MMSTDGNPVTEVATVADDKHIRAQPLGGGVLTDGEEQVLDAELAFMDIWTAIRHDMPAQYIRTFLYVARNPGLPVLEYGRLMGLSQTVASRHISDIGDKDRHHQEGFGLVTYRFDPLDSRKKLVVLTPKGVALARRIARSRKAIVR